MKAYLDLLRDVRDTGVLKPTRAVLWSTGRRVDALSVFGRHLRFDLSEGFPLVTTKRVNFNAVVGEMLWFLRGETNTASLNADSVHIWDQWADENGDLGPIYGRQWRSWPTPDGGTIDQISAVISGVRAVAADPASPEARRLVVSAWNVGEIPRMALPPCHAMFQLSVTNGKLSCQVHQRSADLFLGLPFNIASYALLTNLVARAAGLGVGELIHVIGDAHVYVNHMEQVDEQLTREPTTPPMLLVLGEVGDPARVTRDRIRLIGYAPWPTLHGEVAV